MPNEPVMKNANQPLVLKKKGNVGVALGLDGCSLRTFALANLHLTVKKLYFVHSSAGSIRHGQHGREDLLYNIIPPFSSAGLHRTKRIRSASARTSRRGLGEPLLNIPSVYDAGLSGHMAVLCFNRVAGFDVELLGGGGNAIGRVA